MRILHTADWHLNDRLQHVKRQPDIKARLEEIALYLEQYEVDVMLVAGDLFSSSTRLNELQSAIEDVRLTFKPFIQRGGTILGISGNHDSEALFTMLRAALDLANPVDEKSTGPRQPGRLYLAAKPTVIPLEDNNGNVIQFVLMPYPRVEGYLEGQDTNYTSLEEKNTRLHQAFTQRLNFIRQNKINPRQRAVLISHIQIRGVPVQENSRFRVSETENVVLDGSDIPTGWDYAAYGHIHRPQAIRNTPHIRYAGSVDRFDAGEKDDAKSVVLFEIDKNGRTGDPVELPLNATPIYHIEIADPANQLPYLSQQYPEAERALVSYRIMYQPGGIYDRDEIQTAVERVFPRWYHREINTPDVQFAPNQDVVLSDVPRTVRTYLEQRLADDPDRDEILQLAESLLATLGDNE